MQQTRGAPPASEREAWTAARWPIVLSAPPEIVSAGVGFHGTPGRERYLLPDLWCLHLYPYTARVRLSAELFPIRPGFAGTIPPNTPIEYDYDTRVQHLFVHFRTAAGTDRRMSGAAAAASIPAMHDLGPAFPRFYESLEAVIAAGPPAHRHRTRAFVWSLLCELSEAAGGGAGERSGGDIEPPPHPAVRFVMAQIETHLSEPLIVANLASSAGVSYSYLGRLFQDAHRTTVVGYIRARRMQRAEHLLRHTTLPVRSIAAAVGIPDLHLFNKTVRASLGMAPRAVRAAGASGDAMSVL